MWQNERSGVNVLDRGQFGLVLFVRGRERGGGRSGAVLGHINEKKVCRVDTIKHVVKLLSYDFNDLTSFVLLMALRCVFVENVHCFRYH